MFTKYRGSKEIYKRIGVVALPIVLQNLIDAAVNSVDVLMLNSVGQSAISAVSLANSMIGIFFMFLYGIGTGIAMLAAQYYGKGDLKTIEKMPENTFDEIVDKYVEMNVAHPFMEGNGRSTRIWLDLIFKKRLGLCVDWSRINKNDYLNAMIESHLDSTKIRALLKQALTDRIDDREIFMKGIDYSYYYEQVE